MRIYRENPVEPEMNPPGSEPDASLRSWQPKDANDPLGIKIARSATGKKLRFVKKRNLIEAIYGCMGSVYPSYYLGYHLNICVSF